MSELLNCADLFKGEVVWIGSSKTKIFYSDTNTDFCVAIRFSSATNVSRLKCSTSSFSGASEKSFVTSACTLSVYWSSKSYESMMAYSWPECTTSVNSACLVSSTFSCSTGSSYFSVTTASGSVFLVATSELRFSWAFCRLRSLFFLILSESRLDLSISCFFSSSSS